MAKLASKLQNQFKTADDLIPYSYPKLKDQKLPQFPRDLTVVEYKRLGYLRSRYAAFMAYLNECLAESAYFLSVHKMTLRSIRASLLFSSGGIKLQKCARAELNPSVQDKRRSVLKATAQLKAYQAMLWTLKEYINAIEFEVDRRHKGYRANAEDA